MDRITKRGTLHQSRKGGGGDPLTSLIWKLASIALIVLLLFVAWNQYVEYQKREFQKRLEASKPKTTVNLGKKAPEGWEMYLIANYNFAVPVPRFLSKIEKVNQGGYEYFLRLDKTDFSLGKGMAIGVSTNKLDEEIKRVLEGIQKESSLPTIKTSKNIENTEIYRFNINVSGEGIEPRSFLFFEREGKTISISSTPEQIDTVLELITFVRV